MKFNQKYTITLVLLILAFTSILLWHGFHALYGFLVTPSGKEVELSIQHSKSESPMEEVQPCDLGESQCQWVALGIDSCFVTNYKVPPSPTFLGATIGKQVLPIKEGGMVIQTPSYCQQVKKLKPLFFEYRYQNGKFTWHSIKILGDKT